MLCALWSPVYTDDACSKAVGFDGSTLPFENLCWLIALILVIATVANAEVTFAVSPVELNKFKGKTMHHINETITQLKEFKQNGCKTILQAQPHQDSFVPTTSGFVVGVIEAYNRHHNLVIRPDDVWLAIMIPFGYFVKGNAETRRNSLVKHEGKPWIMAKWPRK
ncbi:hypothetical protein AC1031_014157 [Aphanomyces cochlioides]|nr:hypothetical protein AC1031_014157 [Aphanomyces cochlioides]